MSKSARTRQRILEAATTQLYQVGLSKFRIDELVAELGLTRQTFYRYFKTKNDIIKAVVIEYGKGMSHTVFEELVSMELSFREFLAEGVILSVEMVRSDESFQQFLGDDLPLAISIMVSNFKTLEDELYPIVEPFVLDAQAQGIVKAHVNTRDIMRWVFRTFLSEILLSSLEPIDERRQYLIKMMVPAILIDE
ncbi:MAG: TetR/AcrR family transcriptional regulator [Pseudomonadales bacterium]|nr:TetR/AcrR family transcriptional regulator [Pseudomonadales bacterium]